MVLTMADADTATGAVAFVGRGLYFFGTERARYYVGGAVGGGYIRHRVAICPNGQNCPEPARNIVDTVKGGPALFGPTAGLYYEFSKVVGLQAEVNALAGVPEATFNIDINFGLNLNF